MSNPTDLIRRGDAEAAVRMVSQRPRTGDVLKSACEAFDEAVIEVRAIPAVSGSHSDPRQIDDILGQLKLDDEAEVLYEYVTRTDRVDAEEVIRRTFEDVVLQAIALRDEARSRNP